MKTVITSVILTITLGLTTAQAKEKTVAHNHLNRAIQQEFGAVESVSYYSQGNYTMGTFMLDGHQVAVIFERLNGELLGTARSVSADDLPLLVLKALKEKFPTADLLQNLEISNEEGTFYSVSLESTGKNFQVNIEPNGYLRNIKRIKN